MATSPRCRPTRCSSSTPPTSVAAARMRCGWSAPCRPGEFRQPVDVPARLRRPSLRHRLRRTHLPCGRPVLVPADDELRRPADDRRRRREPSPARRPVPERGRRPRELPAGPARLLHRDARPRQGRRVLGGRVPRVPLRQPLLHPGPAARPDDPRLHPVPLRAARLRHPRPAAAARDRLLQHGDQPPRPRRRRGRGAAGDPHRPRPDLVGEQPHRLPRRPVRERRLAVRWHRPRPRGFDYLQAQYDLTDASAWRRRASGRGRRGEPGARPRRPRPAPHPGSPPTSSAAWSPAPPRSSPVAATCTSRWPTPPASTIRRRCGATPSSGSPR